MPRTEESNPLEKKLEAGIEILQNIFILEAARAGLKKEEVRSILRVDNSRVSKVWRLLPKAKNP